MSKFFVISDTWFNRIIDDESDISVVDNNETMISNWNNVVSQDDTVYVLGGFGISDLYPIVARLNGNIHFFKNYFNQDEMSFMMSLIEAVYKSTDVTLKDKIVFDDNQLGVYKDFDVILSYYPLQDWTGRTGGTFCFHGYNDYMNLENHNISCSYNKWKRPIEINEIKNNIQSFENKL